MTMNSNLMTFILVMKDFFKYIRNVLILDGMGPALVGVL